MTHIEKMRLQAALETTTGACTLSNLPGQAALTQLAVRAMAEAVGTE